MNPVYLLGTIPLQAKKLHEANLFTYDIMENQCFVD